MMDNSSLAGDATVFTNPNINNSSIINNDSVKFEGADAGRSLRKKLKSADIDLRSNGDK